MSGCGTRHYLHVQTSACFCVLDIYMKSGLLHTGLRYQKETGLSC
jgi:hypothetical protein